MRQAITPPARHDEGRIATNHNDETGDRGYHNTTPPPEGPHVQIHRKLRHEPNPSGEFGEWIEDAALHNPLPHLQLTGEAEANDT